MHVHLIDGTYELFRAYFGAPASTNALGKEVGAARGLFRSLLSLLRDPEVTHVGAAFDTVIRSFRNDLFDGYKTDEGVPPDLLEQFELAELVSRALGVTTWSMIEFEADDALATMAEVSRRDPRVERVILCTPDKDLAQCVEGERVVTHDRMRKTTLDEASVVAKFGVAPNQIPDYLALVGDSADGIPGVAGFGAKSAAAVLSACGTLEAAVADPKRWTIRVRGRERLAAALEAERERVLLYRILATLRRDVPLGTSVDDLEWRGPHRASMDALVEVLGDDGLFRAVEQVLGVRRAKPDGTPP